MFDMLNHPFVWGLGIGLAVALYLAFRGWLRRRELSKEVKRLKEHLHTQMEIDAEANGMRREKLDKLTQENENLRMTVQTLKAKPGRKELELLYVYDKALQLMVERAPGFASVWQIARREAEDGIKQSDTGLVPLLKKAFMGHTGEPSNPALLLEAEEAGEQKPSQA